MKNRISCFIALALLVFTGCTKEIELSLPEVVFTVRTFNNTERTATIIARLLSDGNCDIDSLGICYTTSTESPVLENSKVIRCQPGEDGNFRVDFDNLEDGMYRMRVFAVNRVGITYTPSTFDFVIDNRQFTITVTCNNERGTVSGGGTYVVGTSVTLSATPKPGWKFKRWNDGNTQNPRTIQVAQSKSYTAEFESNLTYHDFLGTYRVNYHDWDLNMDRSHTATISVVSVGSTITLRVSNLGGTALYSDEAKVGFIDNNGNHPYLKFQSVYQGPTTINDTNYFYATMHTQSISEDGTTLLGHGPTTLTIRPSVREDGKVDFVVTSNIVWYYYTRPNPAYHSYYNAFWHRSHVMQNVRLTRID